MIEFMFVGINVFWIRLVVVSAQWLKWALSCAQCIFTPANVNYITIIITLEGTELIKTLKKNLPGNILNNHVSVFSLSISPFQPARCAKIPYKESFFKLNFPFSTTGQSKCTGSFNSGAPTSTMQQMKKAKMTKQHRQTTWQRRKR